MYKLRIGTILVSIGAFWKFYLLTKSRFEYWFHGTTTTINTLTIIGSMIGAIFLIMLIFKVEARRKNEP